MSDLIIFENLPPPAVVYAAGGAEDLINRIKQEAKSRVLDISTKKGREEIASLAYKIAKSKTALDAMGKSLIEEAQATVNSVNAERRRIRDELDALKDEVRAPLTAWEEKEQDRIANFENAIQDIERQMTYPLDFTADQIEERLNSVKVVDESFDWQEFAERAQRMRKYVVDTLEAELEAKRKYEADQAELIRLREEEEKLKQQERETEIARQAAEQARLEAEQKAKAEADRQARLAEQARKEAEEKAERERKSAEAERQRNEREKQDAIDRAAQAERNRIAAEQRAKANAQAAAKKAEREKQEAIQRERDRVEAEKKAEQAAMAKREADKAHRAKINNEAKDALINETLVDLGPGMALSPGQSMSIIKLIASGKIPNVKIIY